MELQYKNIEFEEEEINKLVKKLNELHKAQQNDFSTLCYTVYKINAWFLDNEDLVLKSKTNDYYNSKQLFKQLGFTSKQVKRYCNCFTKYMILDDVGSKLKDVFKKFSESKLIELLPVEDSTLLEYLNNGDITTEMTVKEIRSFLKSKSEEDLNVLEESELNTDLEEKFLVLKNDQARKDFLDNYVSWGLWFEEPRLKLKYYRCKIGEKILVVIQGKEEYTNWRTCEKVVSDSFKYFYMSANEELLLDATCISSVLKDMSSIEDKKVYLLD